MAREVLVPVLLDELEKFEIVLHLAFHKGLDADGLIDLMLGKCVYVDQYRVGLPSNRGTHSAVS